MEVLVSSPARDLDLDFNGGRATSPYLSLPSSPKGFGDYSYLSAPTSPSRFSEFVSEFDYFPATPNHDDHHDGGNADYSFAFDVSRESEKSSLSAEDLFDGGKIKSVKPPSSRFGAADEFASVRSPLVSPRQSRSPMKAISDVFSQKKKETQERRGRDRTPALMSSSNSGRRATRSLSPYRNSDYAWEEERCQPQQQGSSKEASSSNSRSILSSSSGNSKSSRKWRLRDLLLFRSASEGRGSNKDPLQKYAVAYKRPEEAKTSSSFRSVDSPTAAAYGSRRRVAKSAHELHYAMKKAETQDLKKKTFLPYKHGILGALAGFGSSTR